MEAILLEPVTKASYREYVLLTNDFEFNVTDTKLSQPLKAFFSIFTTLFPMLIECSLVQFKNAF